MKNELAPFFRTSPKIAEKMIRLAKPKRGEILYDLGAGDGSIAIVAAKKFGLRVKAVEADEILIEILYRNIIKNRLEKSIEVIRKDVFDVGLGDADIVTIFLTPKGNQMIKPKLENEIKRECRVVSHDFEMAGWQHEKMKRVGDCLVYLYRPKL